MTRPLPSLEAPEPGTSCPECYASLKLVGMCGACGWNEEERQYAVEYDEEMERRGRFAFDAGDDWRAE